MTDTWHGPYSIPLAKITCSHKVEKRRRTPKRYLNTPIYLIPIRGLFGTRYTVHDGNNRVGIARDEGRRQIDAYVRVS